MNLLIPDKSTKLLSYYHKSAKWMIPLSVSSYLSYNYGSEPINNIVYIPTNRLSFLFFNSMYNN